MNQLTSVGHDPFLMRLSDVRLKTLRFPLSKCNLFSLAERLSILWVYEYIFRFFFFLEFPCYKYDDKFPLSFSYLVVRFRGMRVLVKSYTKIPHNWDLSLFELLIVIKERTFFWFFKLFPAKTWTLVFFAVNGPCFFSVSLFLKCHPHWIRSITVLYLPEVGLLFTSDLFFTTKALLNKTILLMGARPLGCQHVGILNSCLKSPTW